MKQITAACAAVALFVSVSAAVEYSPVADPITLPAGWTQMGGMHGDIAVSSRGEIYVSVENGDGAGVQVYGPDGRYLRNVPNAPPDFHGFVIRRQADGEFLYGARLRGQTVLKMALDGTVVMTIEPTAVPDTFKRAGRSGQLQMLLTGLDVAPNGDIYVTDGYASDYVHRFDRTGKYIGSFGGKEAPYSFNTLHKLAIDTRFDPPRIIATDRANNRVVHLSLTGELLGVVASDLLLPAAVTIDGDHAIVGELRGRVVVLDKAGAIVAQVGTNTEEGIGTNTVPAERWRTGFVLAPHGVAINQAGDLFVAEFNRFGRVHRFNKK